MGYEVEFPGGESGKWAKEMDFTGEGEKCPFCYQFMTLSALVELTGNVNRGNK